MLQVHFALWHSTSASGPNRRVPPPRGFPPRCPSRAFPASSVSSSTLSLYEAFPHSEVRRLWALFQSGPLSLLYCVRWSFLRSSMRVKFFFRGRRTCFPSAVDFAFCHRILYSINLVDVFRGVTVYGGGRTCFPTAFEYMHVVTSEYLCHFTALVYDVHMHFHSSTSTYSLSCISSISLFSCMTFTCTSSRFLPFFKFQVAWSGVQLLSFVCLSVAQLSWNGQVGRLPSYVQCIGFPQGLVVLGVPDSADFKVTLRRACLEG